MYIDDAVQAVYELYRHLPNQTDAPAVSEIVNVASADTRVLHSFVEEIRHLAGDKGQLEYGAFVQAKEGALSIRCDKASGAYRRLEGGLYLWPRD